MVYLIYMHLCSSCWSVFDTPTLASPQNAMLVITANHNTVSCESEEDAVTAEAKDDDTASIVKFLWRECQCSDGKWPRV